MFWAYHEKETEKRMAKNESLVYRELTLLVGRKYETKKNGEKIGNLRNRRGKRKMKRELF